MAGIEGKPIIQQTPGKYVNGVDVDKAKRDQAAYDAATQGGTNQNAANAGVGLDPWGSVLGSADSERNYGRLPASMSSFYSGSSGSSGAGGGGGGSSLVVDEATGKLIPAELRDRLAEINAQGEVARKLDEQRHTFSSADAAEAMKQLPGVFSAIGGSGGATAPNVTPLPGTPDASDLEFARAKDRIGVLANAKMRDARQAGDPRIAANVLNNAGNELSQMATTQAVTGAKRAADVQDRDLASAVTQRGQTLSAAPSIMSMMRSRY